MPGAVCSTASRRIQIDIEGAVPTRHVSPPPPRLHPQIGIDPPRGVLLYGPPGTGGRARVRQAQRGLGGAGGRTSA